MDSYDVQIVNILIENARIKVSEISSKINLSIPAVSERIRKLEASGIIDKYTAIIDLKKAGKILTALMFISMEQPKYNRYLIEYVQNENDILECYYLAGDFDYVIKIVTDNTNSLESLLNKVKSVQGVIKTNTVVTLSTVKNMHTIRPENKG